MKTAPVLSLRLVALGLTLALAPLLVAAPRTAQPGHHAAQRLAAHGSVRVDAAGPYVQVGTFRILVSVKLGRPSLRLKDGTWLYKNYAIPDSDARGTLVVRFEKGRVSELSIASPDVVAALRHRAEASAPLVATKR